MTVDHSAPMDCDAALRVEIDAAGGALLKLRRDQPGLASALARVTQLVADEAARTPRFARNLAAALTVSDAPGPIPPAPAAPASRNSVPARRRKRAAGKIDPFVVFRAGGESGLREALTSLDVEDLKDIVAEHAMDYDKRAMRWRNADRLQDRIVERVVARETKGDVFR